MFSTIMKEQGNINLRTSTVYAYRPRTSACRITFIRSILLTLDIFCVVISKTASS